MRATNMLRSLACLILCGALASAQSDALLSGLEKFHKGDYAHAEQDFRSALKHGPDQRARVFLALTLAATSRCSEAEPVLEEASQSSDRDVARLAALALAQCQMEASRWDDAASVLSRLKLADPADPDVLYEIARLHNRAWNDTIHQLYEKNPSSFRVNQLSGEVLSTQGQFADAATEFRKAIAKNPQALNLHFQLARALLLSSHSTENFDAALKELDAELALNPRDSVALYQQAQILLNQQQPAQAAAKLQLALDINPAFPEALIALGKLRTDEKKSDEAIALLTKAAALSPKSEAAHYCLMIAYRNAGRMKDAKRVKAELDQLQKAPEGEFNEFLKKLGEKPPEPK